MPEMSQQDKKDFDSFCQMVGFIILNWAIVDQQLDALTDKVFNKFSWARKPTQLPKGVKRRTRFFKEAFADIPQLNKFADDFLDVVERCKAVSEKRDLLVHGVIRDQKHNKGAWTFNKLDHAGVVYTLRLEKIDSNFLQSLVDDVVSLGTEANEMHRRLEDVLRT